MGRHVTLLTGAAGFIGSHLARELVARGDTVHVIVRPGTLLTRIADISDRVFVHRADLANREATLACVEAIAPERVFHLAAGTRMSPRPSIEAARTAIGAYIEPALNLVEALCALPTPPSVFVRTGTIAEYGRALLPFEESRRARPTTPYGAGMLATTDCLEALTPTLNFPVITARLALVYGPGQDAAFLVPGLVDACLSGRRMTLARPGDRRDLVHVDDVVEALLCVADGAGPDCTIVNVASGTAVPVLSIAQLVVALTGCDPDLIDARPLVPGEETEQLCCCPRLARQRFGWEQAIALGDGLRRTIAVERRKRPQMAR